MLKGFESKPYHITSKKLLLNDSHFYASALTSLLNGYAWINGEGGLLIYCGKNEVTSREEFSIYYIQELL